MTQSKKYQIELKCNPAKCSMIALKKLCFLTYGVYNISLDNIDYTEANSQDKYCVDGKSKCVADGKVSSIVCQHWLQIV